MDATSWTCRNCHGSNAAEWTICEGCGGVREAVEVPLAPPPKRKCTSCGVVLLASGLCSAKGGYSSAMACPHACPICRGPLAWDGGCDRCHGCTSGKREDWTFPGDRYELDKGHWQRVDGPRKACTPDENVAGFAAIRVLLSKVDYLSATRNERGMVAVDPVVRADVERKRDGAPR